MPDGDEQCLGRCSKRRIDLHGNHANRGCMATLAARGGKHSRLKHAVSFHGAKAGCVVSWVKEETVPELLLQQFTIQQCQAMFPKRVKVELAAQARKLELEFRGAAKLAPGAREAKLQELAQQLQALVDSVENGAGLRLDGTISHLPSGEQVWYDTTAVHTTCSTKLKAELELTRKRTAAGKEEGKKIVSAGLMATHQKKLDRALAERQTQDGLRTSAPMILPVAVSTHGEFCPGAVRLQEWLTEKYRARVLLEGDRDDGEKPETLTTAFRHEFRSSLLVASCKGLADMLAAAGMPFAGKQAFRASQHTARPPASAAAGGPPPRCASCAGHTSPSAGSLTACNSCKQPLHPHPVCCLRVHDLTWCMPCLAAATSATQPRDADESSAEDASSEDESSSSEGEEEEDEDDHLQLEEVAGSPPSPSSDPWVEDEPARELAPDNATPPRKLAPQTQPLGPACGQQRLRALRASC